MRSTEEQVAALDYLKVVKRCEARAALWERNFKVVFFFFSFEAHATFGFLCLMDVVWYSVVQCSAFMPKVACTGLVWTHTLTR